MGFDLKIIYPAKGRFSYGNDNVTILTNKGYCQIFKSKHYDVKEFFLNSCCLRIYIFSNKTITCKTIPCLK